MRQFSQGRPAYTGPRQTTGEFNTYELNCYEKDVIHYQQNHPNHPESLNILSPLRTTPFKKRDRFPIKTANQSLDVSFFSALPCELQFKIWEQAAPEPRIVSVSNTNINFYAPVPVILHMCSLSRHVA